MKNEFASMTTQHGSAPVLQAVHAAGRLEGLLLSMTLRQIFRNTSRKNMEVVYTFPMVWGAVLLSLEATLGGKRMAGQVLARRDATEQYEDAVAKGDAPVMVQKLENGMFSASLGSLLPGETVEIELSYAQLLRYEQGKIRLVIPATIAPRYGDALVQGGLQPEQVPITDLLVDYAFTVQLDVCGAPAHAQISSPSHMITQQAKDDRVAIRLGAKAWLDRDFVLLLGGLQGESFAISGPDPKAGEGCYATLASFCPVLPTPQDRPLRLKILVDCSGSMAGDSIDEARQALLGMTNRLGDQDQFSFSRFGSQPQRVLSAHTATEQGRQRLKLAIRQTNADLGGTELNEALRDTFSICLAESGRKDQSLRDAEDADVLLITDGEVWDAQRIVDDARRSGHRVYALGVGSAPAESMLQELAEATGGACVMVHPNEDMGQAIEQMMAKMRAVMLVNTSLESASATAWVSNLPRRIASGETLHVFVRSTAALVSAPVLLVGESRLSPTQVLTTTDDLIARLAAAQEIAQSEDQAVAAALAQTYQLVTQYTNLLLVFEREASKKTDGMPDLHQVAQMMPAGWGGTGSLHARAGGNQHGVMYSITPTVWRTNRTQAAAKIDSLAVGDMDDFEIPSFLRTQADSGDSLSTRVVSAFKPIVSRKTTSGAPKSIRKSAASAGVTNADLVAAFNAAAMQGQGFRQTLRAVTDLNTGTELSIRIVKASQLVKGPVNAWACYLLWLHESAGEQEALSGEALALVLQHLETLGEEVRKSAFEVFAVTS